MRKTVSGSVPLVPMVTKTDKRKGREMKFSSYCRHPMNPGSGRE